MCILPCVPSHILNQLPRTREFTIQPILCSSSMQWVWQWQLVLPTLPASGCSSHECVTTPLSCIPPTPPLCPPACLYYMHVLSSPSPQCSCWCAEGACHTKSGPHREWSPGLFSAPYLVSHIPSKMVRVRIWVMIKVRFRV